MTTHDGSDTDIGVLFSEEYEDDTLLFGEERFLKSNSQSPVCNPKQIVKCDNGYNVDNPTQTCQDACEGDCCSGELFIERNPCYGFTGSVCKDGISCSGQGACVGANITSVVRSCYGPFACNIAGKTNGGTGYVGEVIDSCRGEDACVEMAENGFIKSIVNSCQGRRSCRKAAQYGYIGSIIDSCGLLSCRTTANDGTISSIVKSCNGTYSCRSAAFQGSIEGGIVRSCNADQACRQAAISGSIAAITKSCNGEDACRDAAIQGSIGGVGILKACNAKDACVGLAKINDTIFNCTEGELQVEPNCPCNFLLSGRCFDFDCSGTQVPPFCPVLPPVTYNITSGLKKCCNEAESCKNIGDDLPDDCIEKKNVVPWQKGKKDKGRE